MTINAVSTSIVLPAGPPTKQLTGVSKTYPDFVAEAPQPVIDQQLDPLLGISVLRLHEADEAAPISIPTQRQLDAYSPFGTTPSKTGHTV